MSQPVLANRHRETVANLLSRLTRLNLAWQQTLEETLRRDAAMAAEAY
jgi:hypothetical protein